MKILISAFAFSMFTYASKCAGQQKDHIAVVFDADGKIEDVGEELQVYFISNNDTLFAKTKDGNFSVPDDLRNSKATVIFNLREYHLTFESILVTWNTEMPKWTIGVDVKPFDMEKFPFIKKVVKWKKIKVVYYLQNGTGTQITGYRYNTPAPS